MSVAGCYYNEFDPVAAAWLRELIAEDLIAPGVVDERSIKDVGADDLRGFAQHHFFAGIGIWSAALRAAGWPDDRPVWTGSCPCQPFSPAGKGLGFDDPRHLWPDWFRLIAQRRPHTVFGEQSSAAGAWLDLVRADLEGLGAAVAAVDLPAAGFAQGAHIRQRLWWVADLHDAERWTDMAGRHFGDWPQAGRIEGDGEPRTGLSPGWLANHHQGRQPELAQCDGRTLGGAEPSPRWDDALRCGVDGGVGDHHHPGLPNAELGVIRRPGWGPEGRATGQPGHSSGAGVDWLFCRDRRWRPVEAGTFPLAATNPGRVGLLRGYGNSLDFETAVAFVGAYLDADLVA